MELPRRLNLPSILFLVPLLAQWVDAQTTTTTLTPPFYAYWGLSELAAMTILWAVILVFVPCFVFLCARCYYRRKRSRQLADMVALRNHQEQVQSVLQQQQQQQQGKYGGLNSGAVGSSGGIAKSSRMPAAPMGGTKRAYPVEF